MGKEGNPMINDTIDNWQVEIEINEDGTFFAKCPALPRCAVQGETLEECRKNMREAIMLHLESLQERGRIVLSK